MSTAILEEETFVRPEILRLVPTDPDPLEEATREWATPVAPIRQKPPREPVPKQALDALAAVASVLTVRLVLALAVAGDFALAVLVVQHPSNQALAALGIFTALTVPLCWLAQKRIT